jgi:hypothetical protein
MREYSDEQLDVMAEAYLRLRDMIPDEISSTPIALRLVDEIGWGVANGICDEETLGEHRARTEQHRRPRRRSDLTQRMTPAREMVGRETTEDIKRAPADKAGASWLQLSRVP